MRKLGYTSIPQLGWAALLTLTGVGVAHADELADLRANQAALAREQDALKARIDQLAQATNPAPGGNVGPLGSSVVKGNPVAGSFPRSILIPGTDTSIRIGGYIDESLFYYLQMVPPTGFPVSPPRSTAISKPSP